MRRRSSYQAALAAFAKAVEHVPQPIERVEIGSPDGILPGYLIPSGTDGPAPVVIFYNGFDVTKELLYGFIGDQFSRRGIACLVIDTPGTGEPLRLRNVASRPDYEVPTTAIVDYLQTRPDIYPDRIGLLGISLGGYYAPRGAAYEHRIKACVAWGAVRDYGATWQHRWDTASKTTRTPFWQLPWVMGTDTMEEEAGAAAGLCLRDHVRLERRCRVKGVQLTRRLGPRCRGEDGHPKVAAVCGEYLAVQVQQAQLGMLDSLAFLVIDADAVRLSEPAEPGAEVAEIGDQLREPAVARVPSEARPEIGDDGLVVPDLFLLGADDPHRQAGEIPPHEVAFALGTVQRVAEQGGPHRVPGDRVPAHVVHSRGTW